MDVLNCLTTNNIQIMVISHFTIGLINKSFVLIMLIMLITNYNHDFIDMFSMFYQ